MVFPTFEQARANPFCKWCSHFQFGTAEQGLCTLWLEMRYKTHRSCRKYVFIDESEYGHRYELWKLIRLRDGRFKKVNGRLPTPEQRRAYRARNREHDRVYRRVYNQTHREHKNELQVDYIWLHHSEVLQRKHQQYRAKKWEKGTQWFSDQGTWASASLTSTSSTPFTSLSEWRKDG